MKAEDYFLYQNGFFIKWSLASFACFSNVHSEIFKDYFSHLSFPSYVEIIIELSHSISDACKTVMTLSSLPINFPMTQHMDAI